MLNWDIDSPDDLQIFELQKSKDGVNFTRVATVSGQPSKKSYEFADEKIFAGMRFSVVCAEDFPLFPEPAEKRERLLGESMLRAAAIQCAIWPRGDVPADFHEPVVSATPTLLLSGELDPVTPPEYAEQVKAEGSYPDYLHYVKEDVRYVQSWWTWSGKSKKTGEIVTIAYVQFDKFDAAGKIINEGIYGDFSKMVKE